MTLLVSRSKPGPSGAEGDVGWLASDESLWELHEAARVLGVHRSAFDHDHYRLGSQAEMSAALRCGARQVEESVLARLIAASGLEVLPADRARPVGSAKVELLDVFQELLPAVWLEGVLRDYEAPGRHYHDIRHVADVVRALRLLSTASGQQPEPEVLLAALYHDVVVNGVPGRDEENSGRRAVQDLTSAGHDLEHVGEVERLILLTKHHRPGRGDLRGQLLCDADLANLGSVSGRYHLAVRDIRLESAENDHTWAMRRRAQLERFLGTDDLYSTATARDWWEARARANIQDELQHLNGQGAGDR